MTKYHIQKTSESPEVIMNPAENIFSIKGISTIMEVEEFYQPILDWLDTYMLLPNDDMSFIFNVSYFNISSSKRLLFVLYKLVGLLLLKPFEPLLILLLARVRLPTLIEFPILTFPLIFILVL